MVELSLHILDIIENSIRAEASVIELNIEENNKLDEYRITITDNGCGMDDKMLNQVLNPFFTTRTTRKIGLGLSLFKQNAELTGGRFHIQSTVGEGSKTEAVFVMSSIDRQPLGDIAGSLTLLIGANSNIRFIYNHKTTISTFEFDTKEVKEELEGVPINDPDILKALKELIIENLKMIEVSS